MSWIRCFIASNLIASYSTSFSNIPNCSIEIYPFFNNFFNNFFFFIFIFIIFIIIFFIIIFFIIFFFIIFFFFFST